jgi:5-(carboxyamino)imidazole ribonucleotide mutase
VLLLAGSPSDLEHVLDAEETLSGLGIPTRVRVLSAHRTPEAATGCVAGAEREGFGVIIAFAGLAAHLAGVSAAHTMLPVIGVPLSGGPLGGLDAALATLQMPNGAPVGAVSIDGGRNAALLAARILALGHPELRERLAALAERARERYAPERIEQELEKRRKERERRRP